jgi:hypothetical protein
MGRRPRRPRIPNARSTNPFDRAGHRSTACKYSLLNEFLCRFVARGIFAFCLCALRLCCVYLELREEERREPVAPCHSRIAPSQSPSDMRASLSFPVLPPQLPSALVRPPSASASTRLRLAPAHIVHSTYHIAPSHIAPQMRSSTQGLPGPRRLIKGGRASRSRRCHLILVLLPITGRSGSSQLAAAAAASWSPPPPSHAPPTHTHTCHPLRLRPPALKQGA